VNKMSDKRNLEKKRTMSWNKRITLLIALVIVASILVSYSLYVYVFSRMFQIPISREYENTIIRNTSNVEEAIALTVVEYSNCSDIFNLPKFPYNYDDKDPWRKTWASFIDKQVIDYYNQRFESLKNERLSIIFHYEANVSTWDQIHVVYVPPPEGENIYDDAIQISNSNGSILFENTLQARFAYRNDSQYQRITAEIINFSLAKSYVIEMKLVYDEIHAPLAAFFVDVHQIVIVDEDFVPFLFCVKYIHAIS